LVALANIPAGDISGALRLMLHLAMTAWIASIVLAPASKLTGFLAWRPMAFIGAVSYGMYLYHMWCIHIIRVVIEKTGLPPLWIEFPLALALTAMVSGASYHFYEKLFLDLRKRFRK
jgi:peptidoglycan/LPS O-acetylase OafA/YrhL